MSEVRWATFDCFGTLVDWRHGIRTSAELLFPGRGSELLDRYLAHEVDVEREHPRTRYRDVLAETLRRAAADLGLALRADDAWILAATLPSWPVFDDVVPALDALRARGWRLALLTNCDRDLIAATQRRLDVVLDAVVTAEAVGSYKPAPGHFLRFADSFRPDTWVHVAEGYTFDIEPAHQLGLPAVWVNRQGERRDASIAGAVLDGLGGLVEAVESVAGR